MEKRGEIPSRRKLNYRSYMKTTTENSICIFGDSISYGAWDSGGGLVDRIRRSLHEKTMRSGFSDYYWVYNLGIPGNTTEDLKKRFSIERAAREPQYIIFCIGINDSARMVGESKNRVSIERFAENIEELLEESLKNTQYVACVELTPVDEKLTTPFDALCYFTNEQVMLYNDVLKNICDKLKVSFLEIRNSFDPTKDLYDGLHPNNTGHKKIHRVVEKFILSH